MQLTAIQQQIIRVALLFVPHRFPLPPIFSWHWKSNTTLFKQIEISGQEPFELPHFSSFHCQTLLLLLSSILEFGFEKLKKTKYMIRISRIESSISPSKRIQCLHRRLHVLYFLYVGERCLFFLYFIHFLKICSKNKKFTWISPSRAQKFFFFLELRGLKLETEN